MTQETFEQMVERVAIEVGRQRPIQLNGVDNVIAFATRIRDELAEVAATPRPPDGFVEVARKIASEFEYAEANRFEPFRDFFKDPGVIDGGMIENGVSVRITLLRQLSAMLSAAPAAPADAAYATDHVISAIRDINPENLGDFKSC